MSTHHPFRHPLAALALVGLLLLAGDTPGQEPPAYVNSLGMKMLRIPAGSFRMGSDLPTDPAVFH